ncbi:RNA 2',3'-cyclic phosphodiesterase [Bacteroidota bacterium]
MKRLFTAIKVKPTEEFLRIYFKMKKSLVQEKIKWVNIENIHITLKFFGETPEEKIDEICYALEKSTFNHDPFILSLRDIGIFGSSYKPKLIWFGIDPSDELQKLAGDIKYELNEIGYESDRQNFVPHLTIGRIKFIENKKFFQKVIDDNKSGFIQEIAVDEIILYESILHRTGAEYVVVESFALS